jgi:inner membrane protein involved in colicin E2 resistance
MVLDRAFAAPYLAATGPVTTFVESAAASVGAGMLLGGFLAGLFGVLFGWERSRRDEAVVVAGSLAGLAMAAGVTMEAIVH